MIFRNVAQPGSALVWGTRGRRFESGRSDQSSIKKTDIFSKVIIKYELRRFLSLGLSHRDVQYQ